MSTVAGELSISRCRPEDFDAVLGLLGQLWPEKVLDDEVLRQMCDRVRTSSSQIQLCARIGGQVVGFGSLTIKSNLWQEGTLGYIDELVVDAEHRRKGLGKALIEHLVAHAKECGCRCVELDTAFHRETARAFYEALGFKSRALLLTKKL